MKAWCTLVENSGMADTLGCFLINYVIVFLGMKTFVLRSTHFLSFNNFYYFKIFKKKLWPLLSNSSHGHLHGSNNCINDSFWFLPLLFWLYLLEPIFANVVCLRRNVWESPEWFCTRCCARSRSARSSRERTRQWIPLDCQLKKLFLWILVFSLLGNCIFSNRNNIEKTQVNKTVLENKNSENLVREEFTCYYRKFTFFW